MDLNRDILECKCLNVKLSLEGFSYLNRDILECKSEMEKNP